MRDAVLKAQGVLPPVAAPPAPLTPQEELKRKAGYYAVDKKVSSGMVVGLGTGSTTYYAVERLAQKLASGELKNVVAVPTSDRTEAQVCTRVLARMIADACRLQIIAGMYSRVGPEAPACLVHHVQVRAYLRLHLWRRPAR